MASFAHIINPVSVPPDSDLYRAQPITFASMKAARDFARGQAHVNQFTAQYAEDRHMVPDGFVLTPDLERSVLDTATFPVQRKLPLLKDIIDRLYQSSTADILIYTNADIALLPHFYAAVNELWQDGHDAFIINRRTIPDAYCSVDELPLMYAEAGEAHKGWDCFVFDRRLYPRFELGTACIGAGWIGRVMITNMACLARRFTIFTDLHLTFHIGNDKIWQQAEFSGYTRHNQVECKKILALFEARNGPLDRRGLPGRFYGKLEKAGL
jgi:hypothetical protein